MGKAAKHNPRVKLITGLIYKDEAVFIKAKNKLRKKFGKIDFESAPLDFNYTDHYEAEMGGLLKRRFIGFAKLIPIQDLYKIKLFTNRLEAKFSISGNRSVNIDPGYMDLAKLVLASTKDYSHRIFLRKGIFAEIALTYRKDTFSRNDWTYPDYCSKEYIDIFNQIRKIYAP
ncbi:MAG: DUF4416 family protein [Candidatus Omnitrophica bacterium]|nr:DUF4416 family protein [Candidatus Omnitrophota bacterium]MDD5660516.1 DUF4416 family protein [Candidatus Omnitrophota bacterium]